MKCRRSSDSIGRIRPGHVLINSYINAYEDWMQVIKRDMPYLTTSFFVDRFIGGLKDNIKHMVQCQKPETLLSTYWHARQYEKSYLSTTRKTQAPQVPMGFQTRNAPVREARA